jgi:hypothetical protein
MKTKIKTFDCIDMKRKAQEAIRAQVRGMTREEEVAFFREGHEEFEKQVQAAKQQQGIQSSPNALASERTLAKDWAKPKEDEAWQDL